MMGVGALVYSPEAGPGSDISPRQAEALGGVDLGVKARQPQIEQLDREQAIILEQQQRIEEYDKKMNRPRSLDDQMNELQGVQ